jgi:hypothetical protein
VESKEMIEKACEREGFEIKEWDEEHENGLTAMLGQFEVVTPDYEDEGLYEGDKGTLMASIVGSEKYRNRRVSFGFMPDGTDGITDVDDITAVDPVTD